MLITKSKKKLLVLGSIPPPISGATIYFDTLLKTKVVSKFDVVFLDLRFSDSIADHGRFSMKKIARLIGFVLRLCTVLVNNHFDLVYAGLQFNRIAFIRDVTFAVICCITGTKVVGCLVGIGLMDLYNRASWIMKKFIKRGMRCYYAYFTPSLDMCQRYFPSEIMPLEKVHVVPFGIFTDTITSNRRLLKVDDPVQVIYYSHFIRSKGVGEVVAAIPVVIQKYSNTNFLLVGAWDSDAHRESVMTALETTGCGENVKFMDVVSGITRMRILESSDIFVLPTYFEFEGLPLSILEAMSYGCAIITTDHAAITSAIEDGVNGLFCRIKDSQNLAQKITHLLADRQTLLRMQTNNIHKFSRFFTAELFGERLASTLESICNTH